MSVFSVWFFVTAQLSIDKSVCVCILYMCVCVYVYSGRCIEEINASTPSNEEISNYICE